MTNQTSHTTDDPSNLFDDIEAIEQAGGVQPFVREALAESCRLTQQRAARYGVEDYGARLQLARDVVREVIYRRLAADISREVQAVVDREIRKQGLRDRAAIERLVNDVYQRFKPLNDRRFAVLLAAMDPREEAA